MPVEESKSKLLREKMDRYIARQKARIAEAERLENNRIRKEDVRYKIIVGACLIADLEKHPELAAILEASMKRTASPRDAEFLRSRGWKF